MYLAAVYANGNVTTGRHHGEAFSKLSNGEQLAELVSGHVNSDGTFTTELDHLHKDILLIRHAESEYNTHISSNLDSSLTFKGISQAQALARFLRKNIDCRGFTGFTSPFHRCLMTSMPVRKQTGIRFFVQAEVTSDFPEEGVRVPRRNEYIDVEWANYSATTFHKETQKEFIRRLQLFFESLPDRSIVVTHGSVVQTLIEMALGAKVQQIPVWDNSIGNASVTYIKDGTVVYFAKRFLEQ